MTTSRDDHYYPTTATKSSKTPPLGDSQNSTAFFQPGQGGRTVLPPLSSAFPTSPLPAPTTPYSNQYTQPRSSPSRYDYNSTAFNHQWIPTTHTPTSSQLSSGFSYYETHDPRYASSDYYANYPTRPSASSPEPTSSGSRKLPPLNTTSQNSRDERWNLSSYQQNNYTSSPASTDLRPSTGSSTYPSQYSYTTAPTTSSGAFCYDTVPLTDVRNTPPSSNFTSPQTSSPQISHPSYSPPPVSPTTGSDEPTIKKKRKRADAQQLKILNETYARTPFPSTEDRLSLAKQLDMSARSVQIWFQNKRQSMRQTRQSSSSALSQSHQGYSLSSQSDLIGDGSIRGAYDVSGGHSHAYAPRSSQDAHLSPTTSHRRPSARPQEHLVAIEGRKQWPAGRSY